ncbi:MAG TPA: alpha/beta hydrolase [Caulobacteraceae bacterium]|jgi:pimeloyl-ACP methyl ester carboxylesterase|nr:alpha/beta hydrolase [Caulobacteraceae bacterium]
MTLVTDELIELRGLKFHFRDWAARPSGAPALVLLHGYTGHGRSWDFFAEGMSDRYRVIALDQRGHGESGWAGPGGYGIGEMRMDLEAFVAALGLKVFDLVGLSMGGMVAMDYAGRRPAALGRLVIVDIAPEIASHGSNRIQRGQKQSDVFDTRESAFDAARAANAVPPDEHLRHRVFNNLMGLEDGRFTWRYDRALRDVRELKMRPPEEGWASCAAIAAPTLIMRGELSDILAPEMAELMERTIPGSHLATVKGAGHSIPLDRPDGFLSAARGFLMGDDA